MRYPISQYDARKWEGPIVSHRDFVNQQLVWENKFHKALSVAYWNYLRRMVKTADDCARKQVAASATIVMNFEDYCSSEWNGVHDRRLRNRLFIKGWKEGKINDASKAK